MSAWLAGIAGLVFGASIGLVVGVVLGDRRREKLRGIVERLAVLAQRHGATAEEVWAAGTVPGRSPDGAP